MVFNCLYAYKRIKNDKIILCIAKENFKHNI